MSHLAPDSQWKQLCAAVEKGKPPKDAFLKKLYTVIKNADDDGNLVPTKDNEKLIYVLQLIQNTKHRYSLIAYFISGATTEQIAEGLNIDPEVVDMFGSLIIDMTAFRNKLELRDYAVYIEGVCPKEDLKKEIQCGYLYGPAYLNVVWQHGNEAITLREKDVTKAMLLMGYEKVMLAKNSPVESPATREVLKWHSQVLKTIPVHNNIDESDDLMEDAIISIERRKKELEEEQVDPSRIVH
jgi:hypothetical protein